MPPKQNKKDAGGKKPSKPADDKTFGMKNKKGGAAKKVQAQIQAQSKFQGKSKEELRKEQEREKAKKDKETLKKQDAEMASLITAVQPPQKVPFGTDPKTVLCSFFKAGHCDKGKKCKFSHDMNVERKSEKKDIYTDARDDKKEDTMDKWNDEKLRDVVLSKHGNPKTTTDIVCKFFIDAIESGRYGWFWECPNGGTECKYRHALPPGFVLSSQRKKNEEREKENVLSLEDFIEVERHKLGSTLTPVTAESFATWKSTRQAKKDAEQDAMNKAKQAQANAGKANGMSGRDLFTFNPNMVDDEDDDDDYSDDDDDDEWDLAKYRRETEEARDKRELERIAILSADVAKVNI